jgi:Family of unknown function (DUF5709)
MPEEKRHESADLEDYEVLDASDTLDGAPGDDPLDRGVVTPDRWSAGMRYGSTAEEQEAGESLDQLLAEEEPDDTADLDDDRSEESDWDENATDAEIDRYLRDQGPDPRSGRLVAELEDQDLAYPVGDADLVGQDVGIDGGGATAEEAAIHVVDDTDLGSADDG